MTLKCSSSYAPVDEEFDKVSLLLHGDGTNGSTTIVDSSSSPKAVTAVGDAQISTAQSKFGGSSIAFDGNGDYIAIAQASGSFTFGTGDFTIEFWLYPSSLTGTAVIAEWRNTAGPGQFITLYRDGSTLYFFESINRITGTSALTNTVFQHIALCKGSNSTRLFVNGIQVGSTHADTTSYLAPQSGSIYLGGLLGTFSTAGYIDDLRVTKGVARYTANFTPPTAPFPPDLGPPIPQHIVLQSPTANDPLLDLNTQPSLDLQFATSKTLNDRVSGFPLVNHQRDASSGKSAGTYVGSDGLIKNSAVNLATYSEDLTQRTQLDTTTPTATLLQATAQSGPETPYAAINTFVFPKTNTAYTVYADFEKVSIRYAIINFQLFSVNGLCVYDLDTGTVSNQPAGFTCSMPEVETGVYRCTVTHTTGADTTGRISFGMSQLPTIHRVTDPTTADQIIIHRIQIEEGSTATTYIPTGATISGAPRFDHDPVTGESLGLLIEESRTNQFPHSTDFTATSWTRTNITFTPNATTAPDGVPSTADRVQIGATNGVIYNNTVGGVTSNSTISVWIKAVSPGTDNVFRLISAGDLSGDLAATNEWVRYTFTSSTTTQSLHGIARPSDNTAADIYVWGAQFEENNIFSTSYIPTSGSTVTRAADAASITGTNFSSWYNDAASTIYIESPNFPNYGNRANSAFIYISDAAVFNIGTGDGIKFGTGSPETKNRVFVTEGGVAQADAFTTQGSKFGIALSENDFSYVVDSTSAGTDNTVLMPTGMDRLAMTGYGPGLAHISRLTYYPYRLADATLQEITS